MPSKQVPDKIYSSLKYELDHSLTLESNNSIIMSKIQVVDPATNEEIKKNGKPILKGKTEEALTKQSNGTHWLKSKIQFTDVSYHHSKRYFAIQVSYFDPTNLKESILVLRSAPFKVFARRPNIKFNNTNNTNTSSSNRKRKRTSGGSGSGGVVNTSTVSSPNKRRKKTSKKIIINDIDEELEEKRIDKKSSLSEYLRGLDELILFKNLLPKREQKKAIDTAIRLLVTNSKEITTTPPPWRLNEVSASPNSNISLESLFEENIGVEKGKKSPFS